MSVRHLKKIVFIRFDQAGERDLRKDCQQHPTSTQVHDTRTCLDILDWTSRRRSAVFDAWVAHKPKFFFVASGGKIFLSSMIFFHGLRVGQPCRSSASESVSVCARTRGSQLKIPIRASGWLNAERLEAAKLYLSLAVCHTRCKTQRQCRRDAWRCYN